MEFQTNTNEVVVNTAELTPELATTIYELLKEYGNVSNAYIKKGNSDIDYENMILVDREIDRIVSELKRYKSGSVELEPAVIVEDGEVESEAVFYEYTTDEDLALQVNSELLDVTTLLEDLTSLI